MINGSKAGPTILIFSFLAFILLLSMMITGCKTTVKNSDNASTTDDDKVYNFIAKRAIEKAQPQIEKITGRKYKDTKINYEIITRDDLRKLLIEEELPVMRKLAQGLDEDTIKRQLEISTEQRSQNYAVRYSNLKKILYVIPENIFHVTVRSGIEIKNDMDNFLFLLIAHDMVHYLDDQYYDLMKQLGSCTSTELMSTFGAVIDGNAAYVTKKLADNQEIPEKTYINASKASLTIQDETSGAGKQNYDFYIIKGAKFISTIIDRKGTEGLMSAFITPPVSTRQILFPEEYLNPIPVSSINCNKLIESITGKLKTEGMQSQATTVGTMILQTTLTNQGLNKEEAEEISKSLIDGAAYTAIKPSVKPSIVIVQILNFKDEERARKFDTASKLIQKSQEAQIKAGLNTSYNILKDEEYVQEGFDFVRYKEVEQKTDTEATITKELIGLTDSVYITIGYINVGNVTKDEMKDTLRLIYLELLKTEKI
jgi:hypothetical protein